MFLSTSSCIICEQSIPKMTYNLKTTYTTKSRMLLIKLVEKFYKNIFLLHCNICKGCYDLLDELDTVREREKEINMQLKSYISKVLHIDKDVEDSWEQEVDDMKIEFEDEVKIENIDFKKLPIRVKRVPTQRQYSKDKDKKFTPIDPLPLTKDENDEAFEKIQSSIQMNLSKHVEEYMKKSSKPLKTYLCEICGQGFRAKCGYDGHMKKHGSAEDGEKLLTLNKSAPKEWTCEFCGKHFLSKSAFERHHPIHTGQTRYQCDQCGKNFIHHSSFNMHKKVHANIRNHKCTQCDRAFLTKSHLDRHMRAMHDPQKKNMCVICKKRFAEHYNLVAHLKAVHKESITIEGVVDDDDEHPRVYIGVENSWLKDY